MTPPKMVKVRVRDGRAVWIGDEYVTAGTEVEVPVEEAEALIEQHIAERPDDPLDPEQVAEAEQRRAEEESERHRIEIDRRMIRGLTVADANARQQAEDEAARAANAHKHHLAEVVAGRERAAARRAKPGDE